MMMKTGAGNSSFREAAEEEGVVVLLSSNNNNNPAHAAMMNDVILKHLFHLSRPLQLKIYRQVCKAWYTTSLPAWLDHGPAIKLKGKEDVSSFVGQLLADGDSLHDGGKEGGRLEVGGIRQYRKFHFSLDSYPRTQMEVFWNRAGLQMTHLTLADVTFEHAVVLKDFLRCKYTPNLEYLEARIFYRSDPDSADPVSTFPCDDDADTKVVENACLKTLKIDYSSSLQSPMPFPVNWKEFLGQFPNLKCFGMGCWLFQREVVAILNAIKELREEDKSKLDLQSFICCFTANYKDARLIEIARFPPVIYNLLRGAGLRNVGDFRIDFGPRESEELVHNLLSLYASKSLRKLEFHRFSLLQTTPFADLTHLESLTVSGFPLKNLDFLKELPNLVSLRIWGQILLECSYVQDIIRSTALTDGEEGASTLSFPNSLAKFCCNYLVRWTANDISHLQSLMPGLSHLEMCLNNETFRLVCQNWPRLEHLSVYGNDVGDLGIAGLVMEGEGDQEVVYSEPNITSLRYLKNFAIETLDVKFTFRDGALTWRSVVHGFSQLSNLEKLVVESSEELEIRDLIQEAIPFARVIVKSYAYEIPNWFTSAET